LSSSHEKDERTWNSLPNTVFSASSTNNFKMKLREGNFDRFITSVE